MQDLLTQLENAKTSLERNHGKELLPPEDSGPDVTGMPQQLIGLASLVKELQTQAHLIHVNLEAPYFFGVHKFLKSQYKEHRHQFDKVAEMVRTLDTFMPMCRRGLADALPCFHDCSSYEAREMLLTYMANLEDCGALVKQIWSMAHETKAVDIAALCEDICHNCYQSAWMIKATLRKQQ